MAFHKCNSEKIRPPTPPLKVQVRWLNIFVHARLETLTQNVPSAIRYPLVVGGLLQARLCLRHKLFEAVVFFENGGSELRSQLLFSVSRKLIRAFLTNRIRRRVLVNFGKAHKVGLSQG